MEQIYPNIKCQIKAIKKAYQKKSWKKVSQILIIMLGGRLMCDICLLGIPVLLSLSLVLYDRCTLPVYDV